MEGKTLNSFGLEKGDNITFKDITEGIVSKAQVCAGDVLVDLLSRVKEI